MLQEKRFYSCSSAAEFSRSQSATVTGSLCILLGMFEEYVVFFHSFNKMTVIIAFSVP